ncbi:MAG TPA: hypothetical protein DIU15_03685, partial [Deltaproteobacteria bacterium]|nr:hypothetical protein [Deltaproteobacteria bacterium]
LLGQALGSRGPLLLLLDNFEHVAEHGAATISRWLSLAAEVRFLVTSRDRLKLRGEVCLQLEPLGTDEAEALFAITARRVRGTYTPSADDQAAIRELVIRLDGIPLAIELAAARVTVLSPKGMLDRIGRRFELLGHGPADVVPRQATLRAALDWSWDLLEAAERDALAQCSVFRGGFSLEAGEAIIDLSAHAGADVIDTLSSLQARSLLRTYEAEAVPGAIRLGLFESIREYAAKQLESEGGNPGLHDRHRDFFLAQAESRVVEFGAPEGSDLQWFDLDRDNLLAVYQRTREDDPEQATRVVLCLSHAMLRRGPFDSNISLLEDVTERLGKSASPLVIGRLHFARGAARSVVGRMAEAGEDLRKAVEVARANDLSVLEAKSLLHLGLHELRRGRLEPAGEVLEQARSVAADGNHERVLSRIQVSLGISHEAAADFDAAEACYQDALAIARRTGDLWEEVRTRSKMGSLCSFMEGRLHEARGHFLWALDQSRTVGDWFIEAGSAYNLGRLEMNLGQNEAAEEHLKRALTTYQEMANRGAQAFVIMSLGLIALDRGQCAGAAVLLDQAEQILGQVENPLAQGYAAVTRAMVDLAENDLDSATRRLEPAVEQLVSLQHRVLEGIALCVRAMVEARQGNRNAFRATRARARELLGESGWGEGKAMLRALEAYGVLFGESPDPPEAVSFARARVAMRLLTGVEPAKPSENLRATPSTSSDTPAAVSTGSNDLLVHRDGRWFEAAGGARVDLTRKRTLRPLLLLLARAREERPGDALDVDAIFEEVWAGERILGEARKNRVYVSIATLRKAGLDLFLDTRGDGYLIRPDVQVHWAD